MVTVRGPTTFFHLVLRSASTMADRFFNQKSFILLLSTELADCQVVVNHCISSLTERVHGSYFGPSLIAIVEIGQDVPPGAAQADEMMLR